MAIRVLDRAVSELIAAGEVIERPASVVKELVENAMDAGATRIYVSLTGGGVSSLVVRDNGCGIPAAEVSTAFQRHATSKIQNAEDLNHISTMGFRGEALASIAAVSKVQMITRPAGQETGVCYRLFGGADAEKEEVGCPVGTEIRVEQLFYNTPARLKFLKTDVSEGNAVTSYIEKLAVSRPDIAFALDREGKNVLTTTGNGEIKSCIYAVYGREFAASLLEVNAEENGISVHGFVTKPTAAKARRAMQFFYVNGRTFQSRACQAVVEEAMKGRLMSGLHPGCVLFLQVSPGKVDVNVHPAKLEVRFAEEKAVYRVIYMAIRQAIELSEGGSILPKTDHPTPRPYHREEEKLSAEKQMQFQKIFAPKPQKKEATDSSSAYVAKLREQMGLPTESPATELLLSQEAEPAILSVPIHTSKKFEAFVTRKEPTEESAEAEVPQPPTPSVEPIEEPKTEEQPETEFRYIGCFAKTYLLAEAEDQLLIVDQHAAHEKILFEDLKARRENESQMLIEPIVLSLSANEKQALLDQETHLKELGFTLEEFGAGSLIVRNIPSVLRPEKAEEALMEMAEGMAVNGVASSGARALDWIYHSVACRAAVKAGDLLQPLQAEALIRRVLNDPAIRHCPHGRPVYFLLSKEETEKRFGRI